MNRAKSPGATAAKKALDAWFSALGWKPFKFQREVWTAIAQGRSGMLHATTGAGKTYAVWLGALMAFMTPDSAIRANAAVSGTPRKPPPAPPADRALDHPHACPGGRYAAGASATPSGAG